MGYQEQVRYILTIRGLGVKVLLALYYNLMTLAASYDAVCVFLSFVVCLYVDQPCCAFHFR
jgi:hypothetical protein